MSEEATGQKRMSSKERKKENGQPKGGMGRGPIFAGVFFSRINYAAASLARCGGAARLALDTHGQQRRPSHRRLHFLGV